MNLTLQVHPAPPLNDVIHDVALSWNLVLVLFGRVGPGGGGREWGTGKVG